ncbi:hypothetical protein LNTAR_09579 [Lentisphaera araneosa HTCC2155]|uniref:ThuA-like domain-containing protein n=1 Tax=Lentisphaera araneosa HTCC2155 TaxID=313628 RepID=A6DIF7_9BACT|nr:ThuA domain-containing protein [Lentisphaera araneosa]EDM28811.1 hypothetical protein LNTAR_09579 [Lentisphaera araneosa HTCC2155]
MRLIALLIFFCGTLLAADAPHVVFVVGTPHYNPKDSMAGLAKQMQELGWKATVIDTDYNAEDNEVGIEGLEALKDADLAVFYLRFLNLKPEQFAHIENYLKSGKPVFSFRTTNHGFRFPRDSQLYPWGKEFGVRVTGSRYYPHSNGKTMVSVVNQHEILTGVEISPSRQDQGSLYVVDAPKNATVLLEGKSYFNNKNNKHAKVKKALKEMDEEGNGRDDVFWTWENEWGGKVIYSSIGHPVSFRDSNWVRLFVNGFHWLLDKPVPSVDTKIKAIDAGTVMNTVYEK